MHGRLTGSTFDRLRRGTSLSGDKIFSCVDYAPGYFKEGGLIPGRFVGFSVLVRELPVLTRVSDGPQHDSPSNHQQITRECHNCRPGRRWSQLPPTGIPSRPAPPCDWPANPTPARALQPSYEAKRRAQMLREDVLSVMTVPNLGGDEDSDDE